MENLLFLLWSTFDKSVKQIFAISHLRASAFTRILPYANSLFCLSFLEYQWVQNPVLRCNTFSWYINARLGNLNSGSFRTIIRLPESLGWLNNLTDA
ncbi:hypothetical protein EGR_04344 [Echinococcus granulosus]|uniref:Uncharacterized protein n=1 Tax=Echinococcus granulosus TaxID=6210 RepID=W6UI38_ECHGR|nr:hypothetical protein EGR_04344 [Echinococcus granulosus]EUB60718.1 hypothetical protein EGR_04344 [Echinococcus granulosus]